MLEWDKVQSVTSLNIFLLSLTKATTSPKWENEYLASIRVQVIQHKRNQKKKKTLKLFCWFYVEDVNVFSNSSFPKKEFDRKGWSAKFQFSPSLPTTILLGFGGASLLLMVSSAFYNPTKELHNDYTLILNQWWLLLEYHFHRSNTPWMQPSILHGPWKRKTQNETCSRIYNLENV